MYPRIQDALKMLTFLIHNPTRFSSDFIIWPATVCFTKIITVVGAQICGIWSILQLSDELLTIKKYAAFVIISDIEQKIIGLI
jgi:hypothetical protein